MNDVRIWKLCSKIADSTERVLKESLYRAGLKIKINKILNLISVLVIDSQLFGFFLSI